ncbi:transporter, partial [Erythrobacter donghaensis]|uniref:transporter n=1 Tax=Erythrobacter donghaensis TaxID=267135 RepID=UPI001B80CB6F
SHNQDRMDEIGRPVRFRDEAAPAATFQFWSDIMRKSKFILVLTLIGGPAFAQEAAPASSDDPKPETAITLFVAADYVTGDLADREYDTVSFSTGARVTSGRFSFAASIPYIVTSAPEDLIVSGGGLLGTALLSRPSTQPGTVTREGIGDLTLQADYQLPVGRLNASFGGIIKVPTASREAALGTGEVDLGINGQISQRFGNVIPFVTAGYTVVGEPAGFDVRNTLSGAVGSQFLVSNLSSVTVSYSYDQAATELVGDNQSVGLGFATSLTNRLQLGVDARAGLSTDAPDARIGLRLGMGF